MKGLFEDIRYLISPVDIECLADAAFLGREAITLMVTGSTGSLVRVFLHQSDHCGEVCQTANSVGTATEAEQKQSIVGLVVLNQEAIALADVISESGTESFAKNIEFKGTNTTIVVAQIIRIVSQCLVELIDVSVSRFGIARSVGEDDDVHVW